MVENTSTEALKELLNKNPLTIKMDDYGNFEKVGEIGTTLPRNDVRITTEPGDIILYLGTRLCLYYSPNTYTFTRIGKIEGVTQEYLKKVLGEGSVTATFSLEKNSDDQSEYSHPIENPKAPSKNKNTKTAIIAGTVSAAAAIIIVVAITLTCYFKKLSCFGKRSVSEIQE